MITLLGVGLCLRPIQADEVKLKRGSTITGQIVGVKDGGVVLQTQYGQQSFQLTDVDSVSMAPPAALAQLQGATPEQVIATLQPLVQSYQGLKADWVLSAMGQLADAYSAQNQSDQAMAIFTQIDALYPNSIYHSQAIIGRAQIALKSGQADQALATLQPILDAANKSLVPTEQEGRLYAPAFILAGQIYQAQNQIPQALEAYLTVKTIFDQNPALVAQADRFVQQLKQQQPNSSVD